MIKMISKTNIDAFEDAINEFISKDIVVKDIQYRTELETSREVHNNYAGVDNTNHVTRHYAMINYIGEKNTDGRK